MKKEPKRNIFSNIYPILADKHSIGHKIFFSMLWLFIVMACIIFIVSVVSSYVAMSGYTARYVESAGDQVYTTLSSTLDDYTEALNRLSSDSRILYQLYNLYSGRDSYSSAETVTSIGNIVGLMQGISSVEICAASGARTYYGEPITKGSITSSSLLRETFASQDILWNICTTELDNSDEIYPYHVEMYVF